MKELVRKEYEFVGNDDEGFACFRDEDPEMIIVSKTNEDRKIVSQEVHIAKEYSIPKFK